VVPSPDTVHALRASFVYAALTLVLLYPLSLAPGSRTLSAGADTNLFMWALEWDTHAFTHEPLSIFDANIFAPQRRTLAYSENFIGSALFAAPVLWLTHNAVLAMNLVAMLSVVLCGTGAFVLARRLGAGAAAALIGGLIFAFSPPRFFRFDQLHLTTIEWIPFCLAYLHAYLESGRRRDLHAAIAFFSLQALTSGHGAALLVLAIVIVTLCRIAAGDPMAPLRRLRDVGVVGAVLVLPTLLIAIPYRLVQNELQFTRAMDEFVTNASSFAASPTRFHEWALGALRVPQIADSANAYLFPGYLPLLLAAAGLLGWQGRRTAEAPRESRFAFWKYFAAGLELLAVTAAAVAIRVTLTGAIRPKWDDTVLFSIRSPWRAWFAMATAVACRAAIAGRAPFDVGGRLRRLRGWFRNGGEWTTRSALHRNALTYAVLAVLCLWITAGPDGGLWPHVYWLPGLNFIRVPSRFSLLGVLALAMIAAIGFERLTLGLRARQRGWLAVAATAWLVLEFAAIPLGTEAAGVRIPAIDRWLSTQPAPFTIAEVPIRDEARTTEFMLHSTAHWQKTVLGYSGMVPPNYGLLMLRLRTFPDAESLDSLSALGVTVVIVHTDLYPPDERAAVLARIGTFADRLTLAHVEGDGRAYTLRK
jgi:hypothetical protein